jgi:hypothetical protein
MQDSSGPASNLLTIPRILGRLANRYDPPAPGRADPSWHSDMVQQANRSFQARQDAERAAAAAATAPAPNTVKRTPKRTPARPVAKRR